MDPRKAKLLFPQVPDWADPDDPDDRQQLFANEVGRAREPEDPDDYLDGPVPGADELDEDETSRRYLQVAMHQILANQIIEEQPPIVWQTAQRLLATGLDRAKVMGNLVLALSPCIKDAVTSDRPFDEESYRRRLEALPVPDPEWVRKIVSDLVRRHQPIQIDELRELAKRELALPDDEVPLGEGETGMHQHLLELNIDWLLDEDGPLDMISGDRVVEPASWCSDIVLTHRLTPEEKNSGVMGVGVDLAGFGHIARPRLRRPATAGAGEGEGEGEGGYLGIVPHYAEDFGWEGPEGWLDQFPESGLIAVRASPDSAVRIDAVEPEPLVSPELVEAVLAAYTAAADAGAGLPATTKEIVLELVERKALNEARPPLVELLAAAGLERRGTRVAHEHDQWAQEADIQRMGRLFGRLEEDEVQRVLDALDTFGAAGSDRDQLRATAAALTDYDLSSILAEELLLEGLGEQDEPDGRIERAEAVVAFADQLHRSARWPSEKAASRWLCALAHEQLGEVLLAEASLQLAFEADPEWFPAVDRLAWYQSDRGRAAEAARLWRSLGIGPEENQDLAEVQSFAVDRGPKPGRNDPCFCGSGRKYKLCHLGQPSMVPLPDRVGWLCRKAVAFLERNGPRTVSDIFEVALARTGGNLEDRELQRAMDDPLVLDLVLTEGGWFARFLEERGLLLPDDEAILASSWTLVDRSVFEVVDTEPGVGLRMRDLRNAEVVEVRERSFSRQARAGMLVCARVVPDGETNQIVGAPFPVRVGREAEVLDLLDRADPVQIAAHVGAQERPPTMVTRENEPLVESRAVIEIDDISEVVRRLDAIYDRRDDGYWCEMHELSPGDTIVRATIALEGTILTVETSSEVRMDRLLTRLGGELGSLRVVSDERRPLPPGRTPAPPRHLRRPEVRLSHPGLGGPEGHPSSEMQDAMAELQARMEERWCNEAVPALGGLTPRQAAADPTRREALERLLVEFDQHEDDLPAGVFSFRTARLRRLLGLS